MKKIGILIVLSIVFLGFVSANSCGDLVCEGDEHCGDCPEDCGACSVCGNRICEWDEFQGNCAEDCGGSIIPEFGTVIGILTVLGAMGVFFIARRN